MKRTIAAGLVCILLAFGLARAVQAGVWDRQPAVVCYATDGAAVDTFYFNGGATGFDPYPVEAAVTDEGGRRLVRHTVELRRFDRHVFVPWVTR